MFGYQLILNIFSWLAILSPQNNAGTIANHQTAYEVVISTGHKQSPAVIELGSYLHPIIDTSQNSELPVAFPYSRTHETNLESYESQLLYFQIGNAIELELTSTAIIFPFHCFT